MWRPHGGGRHRHIHFLPIPSQQHDLPIRDGLTRPDGLDERIAVEAERIILAVARAQDVIIETTKHRMSAPGGHRLHGRIEAGNTQRRVHCDDAIAAEMEDRAQLTILLTQSVDFLVQPDRHDQVAHDRAATAHICQQAALGEPRRS